MGGPEDFGVRTEGLIRLLDLPLPRSRRLLGEVAATNLGQKPKLGGVRALFTFPLYYQFLLFALIFPKFLPVLLCSFILQKQQKDFSFLFLRLTFEKSKNILFSLFSLLCCRVQLKSVM